MPAGVASVGPIEAIGAPCPQEKEFGGVRDARRQPSLIRLIAPNI
jgi:hypothetical protein